MDMIPKTPRNISSQLIKVLLITAYFSICNLQVFAQSKPTENIPSAVKKALGNAKLPESALSFSVLRISKKNTDNVAAAWQPNASMNPASTMKLVSTLAALDLLGPQYRWHTNIYTNGVVHQGVLHGNLYWQGNGDPKLVPEELSKIMADLRSQGINTINGNLIFDRSAYAADVKNTAPADGESQRPYNVSPDPLLYAFQTLSFTIQNSSGDPSITYSPHLANLTVDNKIKSMGGACGDWTKLAKTGIQKAAPNNWVASFSGKLSKNCGDIIWNVVAINPDDFLSQGVMAAWEEAGGDWRQAPEVQQGKVPSSAKLLLSHQGITLGDAVKDINKFSNNVMARQVFLTIPLEKVGAPANTKAGEYLVKEWLKKNRINIPELVIENGSGLSDIERISTKSMTQLLDYAVKSKSHEVFINSLPIAGTDGTMKNRLIDRLKKIFMSHANANVTFSPDQSLPQPLQKTGALIKTGSLAQVRAIAGFVVSQSGNVYAIASFINHPNAPGGGVGVQDALLTWLLEDGPEKTH